MEKIMTYRRQEAPNSVQIEFVEGCQLRCGVCGLNGIRGRENNYKFMKPAVLHSVITQIIDLGWNPRIEFAMHGEPSFHPNFIDMIYIARSIAPRLHLMMTSNGGGFLGKPGPLEKIKAVFEAGLNTLALDDYQDAFIVPKIRAAVADQLPPDIFVYEYPAEHKGNPHRRTDYKMLTFIQDLINATKGTHSHISNHCGAGGPPNDNGQGKKCARPFRELSVRWDGNVAVCCDDWRGEYKCGNVVTDGLDAVWNGPAMGAARIKLYHGQRDFGPCRKCDARSLRVGLLPDKYGKDTLPLADETTMGDIEKALIGAPYTQPVLRPWEMEA
jgi:radical SAM protein with 4Fe4S-binding SPASM domain